MSLFVSSVGEATTVAADNGAVGTPSVSFASDPDTGMYRVGANLLGLAIGGAIGAELSAPTDGLTALLVRVNTGGVFTLERVSIGAADSGGTGFRLLCIPNAP